MSTYRNRKLLDLSRAAPCMSQFAHACEMHKGVEPAHSDSIIFGRGVGHKTPDWAIAFLCHPAHMALDTFDRETKKLEWLRSFVATQNWLWGSGKIGVLTKE